MTSNADWLAALARRLLHRYTFETMVSPAIADLQCEAAHGRFRIQVRHYIAICAVLVCALRATSASTSGPRSTLMLFRTSGDARRSGISASLP